MARVTDVKNPWGRQGGPNPQRTDLWQVDLSEAIKGINGVLDQAFEDGQAVKFPALASVPRYFPASISIPEQKMKAEMVRRDSRAYNMPSWDEPLDSFKISFVVDDGGKFGAAAGDTCQSFIYTVMDIWRSVVRAGRGAVGSESSIRLDSNYRIDYAWPIYLFMLKGYSLPKQFFGSQRQRVNMGDQAYDVAFSGAPAAIEEQVTYVQQASQNFASYMQQQSTLEISQVLHFENAWLSGFKLVDLSYETAKVAAIEATFYAENLLQIRRSDIVPSFT